MNTPLSEDDVRRAIPGAKVIKYDKLAHLKRLPRLPLVVLYETSPDYGHWVTVLRTPEGIEHFDSYGIIPDQELKWVPRAFQAGSRQDHTHLLRLLAGSGKKINYSPYKLQGDNSAVCGRWAILRNRMDEFGNDAFVGAVLDVSAQLGITPDELVIAATNDENAMLV